MEVEIRIANDSDVEGILDVYAPYCEATTVSFEIAAPTRQQMRERVSGIIKDFPWIVAEVDRRVAGYLSASRHRERAAYRWAVDVAVYIAANQQRRGIGQTLYSTLFSILREQGYFHAFAGITLTNPASVGLHERLGFRRCATFHEVGFKLGQWLDVGWWQLELQPRTLEPAEPRAFAAFRDSPSATSALATGTRDLAQMVHTPDANKR